MTSCPTTIPGIIKPSSLHSFTLAVVIMYPMYLAVCLFYFYINRNTSIFLQKRSFRLLSLSAIGSLSFWATTVLYDVVGAENYNCGFFAFLVYMGCPLSGGFILAKALFYLTKVSEQRLASRSSFVSLSSSHAKAFRSHLRLVIGLSRTTEDKILSARFARSRLFWIWWLSVTAFPYVCAFVVRLATNPVWLAGCTGCELETADWIILITINFSNILIALLALRFRILRGDPLRILRECLLSISLPLGGFNIALILFATDPGGSYASGSINWRSFSLASAVLAVYLQSIHQVFNARSLKRKLLISTNINREDRLEEVLASVPLRQQFHRYLDSELSGETIMFLEACEHFKVKFSRENAKSESQLIFKKFIEASHAPFEVNLSSAVRREITNKVQTGNVDERCFEVAYDEVKKHLVNDGFARFLQKNTGLFLPSEKDQRRVTVTMQSTSVTSLPV